MAYMANVPDRKRSRTRREDVVVQRVDGGRNMGGNDCARRHADAKLERQCIKTVAYDLFVEMA